MRDLILPLFLARDPILCHNVVNHPNGVSLCCPLRMINKDSKNTRQLILICHINSTLCSLESRTLALRYEYIYGNFRVFNIRDFLLLGLFVKSIILNIKKKSAVFRPS